ncbi:conserved protein of unknown function [Microbacterium sp. Nx66]|jgi:hypothetical protein|nr:conserved protein of unknown function [Microbacterium sp. Nx66]
MNEHKNPFRNFVFFITAATIAVVLLAFATYLAIGAIL